MKYLITGGTGTLGTALVTRLLADNSTTAIRVYARSEERHEQLMRRFPDDAKPGGRIRNIAGDVRDRQHLLEAAKDIDIIIHAAAVKRVDLVEYNAADSVEINVTGTLNALRAASQSTCKTFVLISSDKACLGRHSSIELADGENVQIRDLVVGRGTAKVRTLTDNGFGEGEITGWHKNEVSDRKMLRLTLDNAIISRGSKQGLTVTDDHLILTPSGWTLAGKLKSGDEVVTSEPSPNPKQLALLVGTVLGDACITRIKLGKSGSNTYFSVGHAENQLEWLREKYRALREFATRPPALERPGNYGGKKRQPFWLIRLKGHRHMMAIYDAFYPEKTKHKKLVPRELIRKVFSPEFMAAWYMDDGTYVPTGAKYTTSANIRLETQGFSKEDVEWLAEFLGGQGFPCYAYPHKVSGKTYWQLRFSVASANKVFKYIGRFVPPQLRYKLPDDAPPYALNAWDLGKALPHISTVEVRPAENYNVNHVYCLDIKGTHNFCANGFVVHNCEPMQTYGRSKAMAESLTTTANHWLGDGQTAYYGIRYGNVINSNGSLIQKIAEWKANKEPALITHQDMTRFWLTIEDAVDIVMTAIAARDSGVQSGSMLIPRLKSLAVVDVITALYPEGSIKIMGIRSGEKMHESLLGHDEAAGRVGMWRTKRARGLNLKYDMIVMAPKIGPHFNESENDPVDWDWHGRGLYSDSELDQVNELIPIIRKAARVV